MTERSRILDFFRGLGLPRVSISRETLSRLLKIAYPTLDPVLAGLEGEGLLERTPCLEQWRPTYRFVEEIANEDKAAKARRLVEDLRRREQARLDLDARIAKAEAERRALEAFRERRRIEKEERAKRRAEAKARSGGARAARLAEEARRPIVKIVIPTPEPTPAPPATPPADDPWAKIRARHYGKPPLVSSGLRALTKEELMTGRVKRRA